MGDLDKFYTAPHLARACVDRFREHVNCDDPDILIEPSAGDGSFAKLLWDMHIYNFRAYDLKPEHADVMEQDFLKIDLEQFGTRDLHFIGNPPFGKAASLATKFIKVMTDHEFTKSFSLILPASCSRPTFEKRIPLNYHKVHETFCDDFVEFGKPKKIRCVYQIWVKKETEREVVKLRYDSELFSFVKSIDDADFIIGVHKMTGKILPKNKFVVDATQSNGIFVKIHNDTHKAKCAQAVEQNYQLVPFEKRRFVACANVTKPEMVQAMEQFLLHKD